MPVVNTSGFSVQERPRVDYQDARMLTPAYGALGANIGQGLGLYSQFQQIADEAQARPTRQQLLQIQLQDAQNRLAQAPLEQQLRMAQIAEAQQNAAVPVRRVMGKELAGGDSKKIYDDNSGEFVVAEEFTPLQSIEIGEYIGPGGVKESFREIADIKTAAQVRQESERSAATLASARALAEQRGRGREFESTQLINLYNNAVEDGDAEAAAMYKARLDSINTRKPTLTAEDFYDRRVAQQAADAGITYDVALALSRTPSGAEALAAAATANKAAANSSFGAPKLTTEQKNLIRGYAGVTPPGNPVADDFKSRTAKILGEGPATDNSITNPARPASKAEYDALPSKAYYIAQDGKVKQKK